MITLEEFCEDVKLSGSTVRQIFKREYNGSSETCAKVLDRAKELGFDIKTESKPKFKVTVPIPENARLFKPDEPATPTHFWTMEVITQWPVEFSHERDGAGNPKPGTWKCIGFEERNSFHCLPEFPTAKQIQAIVKGEQDKADAADLSRIN